MKYPWIRIAHRGASGVTPENTIAAFKKAIEIGVDAIELDLQGTSDGEIVVIHDATLDRTTNQRGLIKHTSLETIKTADAGSWFDMQFRAEPVPTLVEALACIPNDTMAVLEIKDTSITETVPAIINELNAVERSVVVSFHYAALQIVRSLEPGLSTGWLVGNNNGLPHPRQLCQKLSELGSTLLNVNHEHITAEYVYEIRKRGITLWCWTVDDVERMRQLLSFGVQGITSNYPERFAKV